MPDKNTERILGFSLIELMIAMSLFSLCLLAIMSLQVKALAMVSDANLKNQAVILAASRHELHRMSSKKIHSLEELKIKWNRLIQNKIPEVIIKENKLDDDMQITLIWPSSHNSGKCNNNNKSSFDCFQL